MQVLSRALAQAEERNDEGALALVLWLTAHSIVVGYEGPTFKVSRFLDITGRVRRSHHGQSRTLSCAFTASSEPSRSQEMYFSLHELRGSNAMHNDQQLIDVWRMYMYGTTEKESSGKCECCRRRRRMSWQRAGAVIKSIATRGHTFCGAAAAWPHT